jgi:hypothetical protein
MSGPNSIEYLLNQLIRTAAAAAKDGPGDNQRPKSEKGGDKKGSENGDKDKNGGSGHEPLDFDGRNHGSSQSADRERGIDVKTSDRHPLGDYSRALFDYAKELIDRDAREHSEFKDLKEIFDTTQSARDLYESWNNATSRGSLTGEAVSTQSQASLVPYTKAELLGIYLGLTPTADTNGQHNPGSAHYAAGAVDFSVSGMSLSQIEQAKWMLRTAGILVRNEIGRPLKADGKTPQAKWSNPHLHAQTAELTKANGDFARWSEPTFVPGTVMNFSGHGGALERTPAPGVDRSKIPAGLIDRVMRLLQP